jgi:Trk K+ transport system NAD-binding subunit
VEERRPSGDVQRLALLQALNELGYEGRVAVATHRVDDNEELKVSGAHLILHPYYDAADRAIDLLHSKEQGAFGAYEVEEQWQL